MAMISEIQANALLYGETSFDMDSIRVTSWMDFSSAEKHIDVVDLESGSRRSFIANGLDVNQLIRKIESRIKAL